MMSRLIERLHERRQLVHENPLAFLIIIFEEFGNACEVERAHSDDQVVHMEGQTGMTSLQLRNISDQAEINFEHLIKSLHHCNTNLIFLDNVTNFDMALGKFIKETLVKLELVRTNRGCEPIGEDVQNGLSESIDYLLNASDMRRYQAQSLQRRVQSQINVVNDRLSFC